MQQAENEEYPYYEWQIMNVCKTPKEIWAGKKFIIKLREHKRRYPAFIPERVAEIFCGAQTENEKIRVLAMDIKQHTKSIHKSISFSRFASSQS